MQIEVLKSKVHKVKVTQAEPDYPGNIMIDEDLMDVSGIIANEKGQGGNPDNGE